MVWGVENWWKLWKTLQDVENWWKSMWKTFCNYGTKSSICWFLKMAINCTQNTKLIYNNSL